jgi:oxygen-independent coproporphyrinogen-3 oxidase
MNCSLYIHIPFCKKKCAYCDFISYEKQEELIPGYIDALKKESKYISDLYKKPVIETVFIGGGTPTLLDEKAFSEIFSMIRRDYDTSKLSEVTVEANPGTVTKEKLEHLIKLGANRISIGAQSFRDNLLKGLGRIHNSIEITEAFHMARDAGFKNINLDLMFNLPGEKDGDWLYSLNEAIKLRPEHISTYNLQIEEGTPFFMREAGGELKLADDGVELKLYQQAISTLKENRYEHYEISNFARTGFECKHNITYWKMTDYIGLGAGAHSFIGGVRYASNEKLETYINNDIMSHRSSHKNTGKESMSEMMFLGLRMIKGLRIAEFKKMFGIDIQEIYGSEIEGLLASGMISVSKENILLTEKGLYLANEVFKEFL